MSRIITGMGIALMTLVLLTAAVRAGQKITGTPLAPAPAKPVANGAPVTASPTGNVQRITLSFARNYTPETIRVKRGVPVEIVGDTAKLRGCFSALVIPELNIWKQFTPNDNILAFVPDRVGTFRFSCPMGMGGGSLVVEA